MKKARVASVSSHWLRRWKETSQIWDTECQPYFESAMADLELYVKRGLLHGTSPKPPIANPSFMPWERGVGARLSQYPAPYLLNRFQTQCLNGNGVDSSLAHDAFAAAYIAEMAMYGSNIRFEHRNGGKRNFDHSEVAPPDLLFTALGMVIGCTEEACRLARTQLGFLKLGYADSPNRNPGAHFVLRLMAAYLNEQPPKLEGDAYHPVYDRLVQHAFCKFGLNERAIGNWP